MTLFDGNRMMKWKLTCCWKPRGVLGFCCCLIRRFGGMRSPVIRICILVKAEMQYTIHYLRVLVKDSETFELYMKGGGVECSFEI